MAKLYARTIMVSSNLYKDHSIAMVANWEFEVTAIRYILDEQHERFWLQSIRRLNIYS
ncbi:hypothetical protein TWF694_006027 [Orbilia ellipsospora]|uniref:Uncharacterized protein n=1 Tax=Orbilia ellipsospora TaxID=2528407 RepID=A0AAV9WQZ4_9PEZI